MNEIYMDNHATTPVDPRVFEAMRPYFCERFGNAASGGHSFGRKAQEAVEGARRQTASLIHAKPEEIVFTSGATESNNLAIKGAVEAYKGKKDRLVTVSTEHKSVLDSCKRLALSGVKVTYLPVRRDGILDVGVLRSAITRRTLFLSVMFANNEIGVIQPIAEIGRVAGEKGVLFHCDAAQAVGKVPVDVKAMGIDLLSFTAHKLYGPKGVGALYVRKKDPPIRLIPLLDGGGHERGMRSGTLNVPGIVGLGKACELCQREMKPESARLARLRDELRNGILNKLEDCDVNGSQKSRLPHNLNVSFGGVEAQDMIRELKGIAVSSGSACLSTSPEPSYVLKALGAPEELRRGALRFGLGRFNTGEEVEEVVRRVVRAVKRLRKSKPSA
ncbi:MAG: aminotransferase class V-fold PLP-dependent enzyme [Candidatus Omnitrophica bacterium]|nr:aminotransferase class V-fold PLP-dependent enzyme [Candidatus Omnitrophota bacterium]